MSIETKQMLEDQVKSIAEGYYEDLVVNGEVDMSEYFEGQILDINYVVDSECKYKAVILLVAWGGPNIYVDTYKGVVDGYWWGTTASWRMKSELIKVLDDYFEEYYECVR